MMNEAKVMVPVENEPREVAPILRVVTKIAVAPGAAACPSPCWAREAASG